MATQRQLEMIAILEQAKMRLQSHRNSFVCNAITGAQGERELKEILLLWIQNQLYTGNKYYTYQLWLLNNGHITPEEHANLDTPYYAEKLLNSRIAWIDAMIAELLA